MQSQNQTVEQAVEFRLRWFLYFISLTIELKPSIKGLLEKSDGMQN